MSADTISPTPRLLAQAEGAIGWMVFNNPGKRNALSLDMWAAIPAILDRFERDPAIRVVVLRGAGEEAFISGADVSEFEKVRASPEQIAHYDKVGETAVARIQACPKPTIAMIHGFCIGGGVGVALSCDLRLAAESGRFAIPAARLGVSYRWSDIKKLMDLIGPADTKEIFYTARHFYGRRGEGDGPRQPRAAGGRARGLYARLLRQDRRERALDDSRHQGRDRGTAQARRGDRPRALRGPGQALLRQRGLHRGPPRLRGKAQARVQGEMMRFASIGCLILAWTLAASPAHAQAARTLVNSRESLYNNIYVYREGPYVSMTFGYNRRIYTESVYNTLDDRDLPVPYTRYMTESLIYAKNIHSILEIGFGGGRTSWYLHRFLPNVSVTSVELDPAVVALSRKYFGIRDEPNFQVVNRDGRIFLSESKDKYDIILIDAYRGPFVPFHLLTKEFYQLVKSHLAEGGVVAQNIEPSTMLFNSAVKTIHAVFPQLDFYRRRGQCRHRRL